MNNQKLELRRFFSEKTKKAFSDSFRFSQENQAQKFLSLLKTFDWESVETAALFCPLGAEPDLSFLQKEFSNMKWVYPSMDEAGSYSFVYKEADSVFKKSQGFPQILSGKKCSIENIQVFLVPGLAFDRSFNRLGRGKGFYDRALSQSKESVKIGVGWSCQISQDPLPYEEWDIPMDILLTEKWLVYSKKFFEKNVFIKKFENKINKQKKERDSLL